MIPSDAEVVRKTDSQERFTWMHSEGTLTFVEQEWGAWFRLDLDTGRLFSQEEEAYVRGDIGLTVLRSPALLEDLSGIAVRTALQSHDPLGFGHALISPEGLRCKLEALEDNFGHLTPEEASRRLQTCVSEARGHDEFHQFYSEEIQVYLDRGADPSSKTGDASILASVLLNHHLCESIALRSAELLCKKLKDVGHPVSFEEAELLRMREQKSPHDYMPRWSQLLRQARLE